MQLHSSAFTTVSQSIIDLGIRFFFFFFFRPRARCSNKPLTVLSCDLVFPGHRWFSGGSGPETGLGVQHCQLLHFHQITEQIWYKAHKRTNTQTHTRRHVVTDHTSVLTPFSESLLRTSSSPDSLRSRAPMITPDQETGTAGCVVLRKPFTQYTLYSKKRCRSVVFVL